MPGAGVYWPETNLMNYQIPASHSQFRLAIVVFIGSRVLSLGPSSPREPPDSSPREPPDSSPLPKPKRPDWNRDIFVGFHNIACHPLIASRLCHSPRHIPCTSLGRWRYRHHRHDYQAPKKGGNLPPIGQGTQPASLCPICPASIP